MKTVKTHLDLDASAEEAWAVLSDMEGWSSWNPVIPRMKADPRLGGKVKFEIHVAPGKPMNLASKIVTWEENRGLAWGGGLPGVFTGRHYFELEPLEDGRCRITHGEDFRGLVPAIVLNEARLANIEAAYAKMNEALAAEVARRRPAAAPASTLSGDPT